jgi:hypothetical protein
MSVIQASGVVGLSSLSYSFPTRPTAGNGIIFAASLIGAAAVSITSVADNQGVGNVYTRVKTLGTATVADLWWCPSIGATSGTFTITPTTSGSLSGGNQACGGLEFNGYSAVDQTGTGTAGSNTLTATCSAPNANALDLVVMGGTSNAFNPGTGYPPTSGYTGWFGNITGSYSSWGYKILSALETSAGTLTWNTANGGNGVIATFLPATSTALLGQACL